MSAEPSRVAILLATYNGACFIEDQLRSIQSQTHTSWHVFVRDDGSTDATLALIARVLAPNQYTQIDASRAVGGSPSRNFFAILQAVDLNQFGYVAFCDQDDIWAPAKLERALTCLKEAGAGGYSSNMIPFDNDAGRAWFLRKSYPEQKFDYMFQGASAGCTYVLTKRSAGLLQSKVESICRNPPLGFSHDWSIYAICRSYGERWFHDTRAYIFYRQHPLNVFGAMPSYEGLLARFKLARSGWYRTNILWLGTLLSGTDEEQAVLARVKRFGLADRLWLAQRGRQFRRRGRDAFLFAVVLLGGFL